MTFLIINRVALAKHRDTRFGSIRLSVCPSVGQKNTVTSPQRLSVCL